MSAAEEEDGPVTGMNWDNVVEVFAALTETADEMRPRPAAPRQPLPETEDIGEMESRLADLSFAETDADKVAALKSMTLWLAQWKF